MSVLALLPGVSTAQSGASEATFQSIANALRSIAQTSGQAGTKFNEGLSPDNGTQPFDFTPRFDLEETYENDPKDSLSYTTTFRYNLKYRDLAGFRFDMPFEDSDKSGSFRMGAGDFLAQGLFAAKPVPKYGFVWGYGVRFTFPTATYSEDGKGKYIVAPAVGFQDNEENYQYGLALFEFTSYAGDPDRSNVGELSIMPTLQYLFQHGWWFNYDPDIRYKWSNSTWWVPLTFEIGDKVNRSFAISLESTFPMAGVRRVNSEFELKLRFFLPQH